MSDDLQYLESREERLLLKIAFKCLIALDPCHTRESVIRMVEDIYNLAAPPYFRALHVCPIESNKQEDEEGNASMKERPHYKTHSKFQARLTAEIPHHMEDLVLRNPQ